MGKLNHFDSDGKAIMVDVGAKPITERTASAEANIVMSSETLLMIKEGGHKKGDVLGVARLAGIMAAKKTSSLIPLCHPLALTSITVDLECISEKNLVKILTSTVLAHSTTIPSKFT